MYNVVVDPLQLELIDPWHQSDVFAETSEQRAKSILLKTFVSVIIKGHLLLQSDMVAFLASGVYLT
jgi:hypothetical protein